MDLGLTYLHEPNSIHIFRLRKRIILLKLALQLQHEQSLQLESRIAGGAAQVFCGVYGSVVVGGAGTFSVVDFTSTGIAEPVLRERGRWFKTDVVSIHIHFASDRKQRM